VGIWADEKEKREEKTLKEGQEREKKEAVIIAYCLS